MSYSVQDVGIIGKATYDEAIKNKNPIYQIENYDVIKNETEKLLVREKTIFIINTIVSVGLIITLFQVI